MPKILATCLAHFAQASTPPPPGEAPHVVNFTESVLQSDGTYTPTIAKVTYGAGIVEPNLTLACVDASTPIDVSSILAADGPKASASGVVESSETMLNIAGDQISPFAGMVRLLAVVAH